MKEAGFEGSGRRPIRRRGKRVLGKERKEDPNKVKSIRGIRGQRDAVKK